MKTDKLIAVFTCWPRARRPIRHVFELAATKPDRHAAREAKFRVHEECGDLVNAVCGKKNRMHLEIKKGGLNHG